MTRAMNDIERIGTVIYEAMWEGEVPKAGTIEYALMLDVARAAYLAVLDCLEEPSKAMCNAHWGKVASYDLYPDDERIAIKRWQAMLAVKRKEIERQAALQRLADLGQEIEDAD